MVRSDHTPVVALRQHFYSTILAGCLLLLSAKAAAEPDKARESFAELMIDEAHDSASALLNSFASQIDNYFAEDIADDGINKTSATLRFDFADPANDDFSIKAKLKLRLVLPRSEQRLRLLFDVDEDDQDESGSTVQALSENVEDQNLALALRFIRQANERLRFNVDVGARKYDQKIQGFTRLRVSTENKNPEGWSYGISNDLRQYHSSGHLNRLRLDFWSNINKSSATVFRSSTGFESKKRTNGSYITQTFGFYKKYSPKTLVAFEALAGYRTSPEQEQEHYEGHQFRIRYRRNAFRPWFHFEVWPGIAWLTENNSDPKFSGLVRMEVRIGQNN